MSEDEPKPRKDIISISARKDYCPAWWHHAPEYAGDKPRWRDCDAFYGAFTKCSRWQNRAECWERWDKEMVNREETKGVTPMCHPLSARENGGTGERRMSNEELCEAMSLAAQNVPGGVTPKAPDPLRRLRHSLHELEWAVQRLESLYDLLKSGTPLPEGVKAGVVSSTPIPFSETWNGLPGHLCGAAGRIEDVMGQMLEMLDMQVEPRPLTFETPDQCPNEA